MRPITIRNQLLASLVALLAACSDSTPPPVPTDPAPTDPEPSPVVTIPDNCQSLIAETVVNTDWTVESYDLYEFEAAFDATGEAGAIIGNAPTLMIDGESEDTLDASSNGQFIFLNGNSGKIYLHNIVIPEDGVYEFKLFGNTQQGYKKQHLFLYNQSDLNLDKLEDNQEANAAFSHWSYEFFEFGDSQWREFILRPELTAGTYSFEMRLSWGFDYFDRLEVSSAPIKFPSQYGITQGVHYISEANAIAAPLKLNTNKLVDVTINGEPTSYSLNDSCDQLTLPADSLSELGEGTYTAQVNYDYLAPTTFEVNVVDGALTGSAGDRYEAEDVTLGERMLVREHGDHEWDRYDDLASAGGYVSMENTGSMAFQVNVPQAGLYHLSFRYRTGSSDKTQDIQINDEFAMPGAGFRASNTYWETATFPIQLKEGSNKIEIIKSWGFQDFDYFDVSPTPIAMTPKVGPKEQSFYLEAHKQLSIKIDPYGNELTGATISGMADGSNVSQLPLTYTVEEYKDNIEGRYTSVIVGGFFVHLDTAQLATLAPGQYTIEWTFESGYSETTQLDIIGEENTTANDFVVIFLDSSHGNSAIFLMPSGKTLVVDLGQWWVNLDRLIPFLKANNINPDYLWLTHPHGDHIGGTYRRKVYDGFISDGHEAFVNAFPDVLVQRSMHEEDGGDRTFFASGREFDFEGTDVKILNTFGDSCSEETIAVNSCDLNANSLAFSMNYKGFVVQFQGDIYAHNQNRILREYGADAITGQIFYGNHHWHGSISPDYVKTADPALIFVPASEVVYARGAFTQDAMAAVNYLRRNGSQYKEMLMSFDTGHVIMRANVSDTGDINWSYESLKDLAIEGVEETRYPDYTDEQKQALHSLLYTPNLDKWRTPTN